MTLLSAKLRRAARRIEKGRAPKWRRPGTAMSPRAWDRLLWGVEFHGSAKPDLPMLIGAAWSMTIPATYPGVPSRALLFTTRVAARAWCAEQHARYRGRTDCCGDWRFRAVRVRERVTPCPR